LSFVSQMNSWTERLRRFMFPAESDAWLAYLRVGLGIVIICYCWSLRSDWNDLFGASDHGTISRSLAEKILSVDSPLIPRLGWISALGARFGLNDETVVSIAWVGLLCAGFALLLGILPRFFAVLSWFLHLSVAKTGEFVSYGLENFITIGLFYLMLSPLPDRLCLYGSWQNFGFGRHGRSGKTAQVTVPQPRSRWLGFWRRVLQVHLCFIYFFGGLSKCLGSGWWDGSSLWRALIRPPFNVVDPEILVRWKYFFPAAGIGIMLLELSYPYFIWGRSTRKFWLIGICAMHAAIGLTMGMYLFAFVMIVLNVAAFGGEALGARLSAAFSPAGALAKAQASL
jgi:hypothetical protein